ncbi:DUF3422 family protein [Lichenicoccus roseus]|uniref:DUF3422 domain-containing protein n=1 Tax=Lichenicoccus roseus TaxID=2683649 RepID=A0A5R9J6R0_9PROT|nr:DUF3422 domain-containing protein [Lichenicoccus roseus]TLU71036.1 DUF3422 domain-containing protein [Lichenicoccus roseus]
MRDDSLTLAPEPVRPAVPALPRDHPQRVVLNDEVHARPSEILVAPLRVSYLAIFAEGEERAQIWRHVQELARRHGAVPASDAVNHYSADLGPFRIKCERHTEFLRLVFIVEGRGQPESFDDPALQSVPADWLAALPGQLITAANVLLQRSDGDWPQPERIAADYFDGNALVGASIADGAAFAFTDFRIRPDGFSRLLVMDHGMTSRQAGRTVQRLLEIDTYRILALLALPMAHALAPFLAARERELAEVTRLLVDARAADEPLLFDRLTRLEAEMESEQSRNHYRFSASVAYEALVDSRIAELREERLAGLQTFREFLQRRFLPAMETCRSTAANQESLSQRLNRVTQLLSTRVDITREAQTQEVLASMDRRARLQLRLQETVEGLSVAAITYYIVGLVGYLAKGMRVAGAPIEVELVMAASIPVVLVLTALALRHRKRRATRETR